MNLLRYSIASVACILALSTFNANAATQTSTMAVTANVAAACTISANPLAFGSYTGVQVDASTTIVVNCTNGAPYTVYMDAGTGSGATTAVRKLTSGSNTLSYAIYSDSARTTLWKDAAGPNVTGTGTGVNQTLTAYGRLSAQATPTIGNYSDSVIVTIQY